jgi:hypothetical protein
MEKALLPPFGAERGLTLSMAWLKSISSDSGLGFTSRAILLVGEKVGSNKDLALSKLLRSWKERHVRKNFRASMISFPLGQEV